MNAPRVVVNFRGCRTRADVRGRFVAWLDQHYAHVLRRFATERLLGDNGDDESFEADLLRFRAELARNRTDLLAHFEGILDEVCPADA